MNGPCEIEVDEFRPWPKMARLSRECIISEKIDGSNGQIYITDSGKMLVGSRTRWITPENDNYGFAAWVRDNAVELAKLGPGRHFGEWYGAGIQRRYGLTEKRFALFNAQRWTKNPAGPGVVEIVRQVEVPSETLIDYTPGPSCCSVVPVLYRGHFSTGMIEAKLAHLGAFGSVAAPGFMDPEGIIIYHVAGKVAFKKTLGDDGAKGTP